MRLVGVGVVDIRSQLHGIFIKTGVRRRSASRARKPAVAAAIR